MGIDVVHGTVLHHQLRSGLLAHLGDSRHIVRGIPHQSLQINELQGRDLIGLHHVLRIVVLYLRPAHLGLGYSDHNMLVRNLQQIPVAGHKRYPDAFRLRLLGQSPQNVVRLQPRLLHDNDAHSLQHILHHRHLLSQLLRHGLSGPLIFLIHPVTEGRRMHVKCYGQIIGPLLLQNLEHNIQKSKNRIGMQPLRIGQVRHAVERPVQNAVPVDQDKLSVPSAILLTHG